MKKYALCLVGLVIASEANAACKTNECNAGNLCYSDGAISCAQAQRCKDSKWTPLETGGTICSGSSRITIIAAHWNAQMDDRAGSFMGKLSAKCDNKETCDFLPKGPDSLLGDLSPGSHYSMSIKYICRDNEKNTGIRRLEVPSNKDQEPVNFNCFE